VSCGLHDVLGFETAGRPAVLVASSVFAQAADDQAAKLGAPDLRRVFVEHPVQDRTDDELRAMARAVAADLQAALAA
jgi:Skp family chaperone for outer membrane proteins